MRPTVLIYRDRLTFLSERFIVSQGETLQRYVAHYVGIRAEPAVATPRDRTTLLCTGSPLDRPREFAFKTLSIVPKRLRDLRALDPELVHAHFGPDGVRALPLASAMRAPLVVTFHGFDATMTDAALRSMKSPAIRQYPRRRAGLIRRGDHFIAVSEFVRRQLLEQGFAADKVTTHYIGIDTQAFRSASGPRERIALFVARMEPQKGIDDFVRALADVQSQGVAIRGVAVGDGPARAGAERLAQTLGARVDFVGAQSAEVVQGWMQRSLIFCVPSRKMPSGWQEGFGLVFAEAQASGLPVVSYANGGIPEVVADRTTGLLAADGDWQRLAANLATLANDDAMRRTFADAGTARVRRSFDLRTQTSVLESIYDRVLARRADPRTASATR